MFPGTSSVACLSIRHCAVAFYSFCINYLEHLPCRDCALLNTVRGDSSLFAWQIKAPPLQSRWSFFGCQEAQPPHLVQEVNEIKNTRTTWCFTVKCELKISENTSLACLFFFPAAVPDATTTSSVGGRCCIWSRLVYVYPYRKSFLLALPLTLLYSFLCTTQSFIIRAGTLRGT